MVSQPRLIIQLPRGSAVAEQLGTQAPPSVAKGEVVVEVGATDAGGQVVLSVPSPKTLAREADDVRRVIVEAGTGVEPLVVEVEAAEELREDELAAVLDAAGHTSRAVILRVIRNA